MTLIPTDILNYWPDLKTGLTKTLLLMFTSLVIAGGITVFLSYLLFSARAQIRWLINGYIAFIRGTPLLVQIYLIYYGLSAPFASPFASATLALALNSAAYSTVLLSSAIARIPKGEIEAGMALGLSRLRLWFGILFPRAMRRLLPAYSNEVIIVLKSTALASTITLMDLMGVVEELSGITYDTLPWLNVAGILYASLTLILVLGLKWVERKWR